MAERSRAQRLVIVALGWLGAAAVATGVALAAVSSIGTGIFGSSTGPLDQQQVTDALATVTPPPEPAATPSRTPEATGTPQNDTTGSPAEPTVITSRGGTVVVRCTAGDRVEALSWSPAQGFRVDDAERGPAREVRVEFESGDQEVEISVRCVDGEPDAAIEGDD